MNKPVSSRVGLAVLYVVSSIILAMFFSFTDRSPALAVAMGFLVAAGALLLFVLELSLPALLHELGHYAAAKLARWNVVGFAAMGFDLSKQGNKWKVQFDFEKVLDGQVLTRPKDLSMRKWIFILVSGPAVGLIVGTASLLLSKQSGDHYHLIDAFGWINLFYSAASFYPYIIKGHPPSDGWNIRLALLHPATCRLWLSLDCLSSLVYKQRPKDWSLEELRDRYDLPGYIAYWHLSSYWSRLDGDDVEGARVALDKAWELVHELEPIKILQAELAFEVAMFYTRFYKNEIKASLAYGLGLGSDAQCPTKDGYDIAKAYVDGRLDEAELISRRHMEESKKRLGNREHLDEHVDDWYRRILDPRIPLIDTEAAAPAQ